ncbi:MAG: DUF2153 family protein [Candidatus Bathyarchaeota archaeon]
MAESWVQECKRILEHLGKLGDMEGKDRLDMVRRIRFIIFSLQRSVSGWIEWVENPDVMANFSLEDLKEINKNLTNLTQPFVEYDCEMTSRARRDLGIKEPEPRREQKPKAKDKKQVFYVQ